MKEQIGFSCDLLQNLPDCPVGAGLIAKQEIPGSIVTE